MDQPRVLIVEDDRGVADALTMVFASLGFTVCGVASRSAEAVELARKHAPDLLLIDVHLANGDSGVEAAQRIRRERPVPMILVTGHTEPEDLDHLSAFDAAEVLVKPYDARALEQAVARMLQPRSDGSA